MKETLERLLKLRWRIDTAITDIKKDMLEEELSVTMTVGEWQTIEATLNSWHMYRNIPISDVLRKLSDKIKI